MSLIDDIRKDRERPQVREKSASEWVAIVNRKLPDWVEVVGSSITIGVPTAATNLNGEDYVARHADARRIARVPEMEAALLAAEELAKAADDLCERYLEIATGPDDISRSDVDADYVSALRKVAAYRAATGAA